MGKKGTSNDFDEQPDLNTYKQKIIWDFHTSGGHLEGVQRRLSNRKNIQ